MLKEQILDLLEKDREFRYAVAGLIGMQEILQRLDRHEETMQKMLERLDRHEETMQKMLERLDRHEETIQKILERLERHEETMQKMLERLDRHEETLQKMLERLDRHEETMQKMLERLDRHEEAIKGLWENQNRLWEEVKALRENQEKLWQSQEELRREMNLGFKRFEDRLTALGARWGIFSEESFRNAVKEIAEKEFGARVERWTRDDERGFVFGKPAVVDIDLVIRDGRVILIEIKSSISIADVAIFARKAEFYESSEGIRASRLIMISPFIEEKAREIAAKFGIELISY
jgi:hypothetical protein